MRKQIDRRADNVEMWKEHLGRRLVSLPDEVKPDIRKTHVENAKGEERPALRVEVKGDPQTAIIIAPRKDGSCDVRRQEQDPQTGQWGELSQSKFMGKQAVKALLKQEFAQHYGLEAVEANISDEAVKAAEKELSEGDMRGKFGYQRAAIARAKLETEYKQERLQSLKSHLMFHFEKSVGVLAPDISIRERAMGAKAESVPYLRAVSKADKSKALIVTADLSGSFSVAEQRRGAQNSWIQHGDFSDTDAESLKSKFAQYYPNDYVPVDAAPAVEKDRRVTQPSDAKVIQFPQKEAPPPPPSLLLNNG